MDELVRELNRQCDAQPFHTGWYLHDLHSGQAANRSGDLVGPSASTRKVSILIQVFPGGIDARNTLQKWSDEGEELT